MIRVNKPTKILLIEDSKIIQKIHFKMFSALHCQIDSASNGKQGVFKAKKRYDIIFTDIDLPDINGNIVIKIIREYEKKHNQSAVPIIVLSTHTNQTIKDICFAVASTTLFNKTHFNHYRPKSITALRGVERILSK